MYTKNSSVHRASFIIGTYTGNAPRTCALSSLSHYKVRCWCLAHRTDISLELEDCLYHPKKKTNRVKQICDFHVSTILEQKNTNSNFRFRICTMQHPIIEIKFSPNSQLPIRPIETKKAGSNALLQPTFPPSPPFRAPHPTCQTPKSFFTKSSDRRRLSHLQ